MAEDLPAMSDGDQGVLLAAGELGYLLDVVLRQFYLECGHDMQSTRDNERR